MTKLIGYLRFLLWVIYTFTESFILFFTPRRYYKKLTRRWSTNMLFIAKAKLNILWNIDREEVIALKNAIVVFNHLSYTDPIVLEQMFPKQLFFLAKKELYKVPLFGWAVWWYGNVRIDRQRGENVVDAQVKAIFDRGGWLFIAPEGTRSEDGKLREKFKTGAFRLAHQFNVPLIVVGLKGVWELMPKHSFWLRTGKTITGTALAILDPHKDPESLKAQAHRILSEHLGN